MSGHSKWAQIKRQKGVADAKRGTLFTKLGNAISVAARDGEGNPESNFKLRLAIEKARQSNMPKENIERAIKRGTGELPGTKIKEIVYEAFGPEGIALLIEAVTDNKNRTTAAVRNILSKHKGNLGETGSVNWMFNRKGVIYLKALASKEEQESLELELIDQGAEDFKEDEEALVIYTQPENLEKVKRALEQKNILLEHAALEFVPKNTVKSSDLKNPKKINNLIEELEDSEEINNFYSNYESR